MGRELLEKYAARQSRERIEELVEVWAHATRVSCWEKNLPFPGFC